MKKGLVNQSLLVLVLTVLVLLVVPTKRYVYLAYQHLGYSLGLNLNNIATDRYLDWVKSQPTQPVGVESGIFLNRKVAVSFKQQAYQPQVLGDTSESGEKRIEIDLSDQRLYMKENDKTVADFSISTGKWAPTPTGSWRIWTKLRYTTMQGGSKALGTYYNLPNVPYVMYYHQGYGIHGAYWHNNFGQPMSHGCTNMRPEEAGIVFAWADVGTKVVVHL